MAAKVPTGAQVGVLAEHCSVEMSRSLQDDFWRMTMTKLNLKRLHDRVGMQSVPVQHISQSARLELHYDVRHFGKYSICHVFGKSVLLNLHTLIRWLCSELVAPAAICCSEAMHIPLDLDISAQEGQQQFVPRAA